MSVPSSERDPLEELAEEFAARYRRGEQPSLTEYTEKYPELAEQIRDLFPALMVMEQFGSVAGPPTGPFDARPGDRAVAPEQLGEYRIVREVGRGGMGVVYEAVQESLGRHVALKVLPFHQLMSPTHLERFRREARAAAQLHHTNIVPVFGVGEAAGIHYYAMQFIQGQGLDAVLQEVRRLRTRKSRPPVEGSKPQRDHSVSIAQGLLTGRFQVSPPGDGAAAAAQGGLAVPVPRRPPSSSELSSTEGGLRSGRADTQSELASQTETQYCRSVAQVGVQVAEALASAHKQRILHRDIKPSNLLLDTQGTVWITDFGLAKAEGSDELTSPGDIVGTVRFMAPERFQGKADPRSDVYSTGITLYEMLTLRPAFADSNRARLLERVAHEDPPRPRKLDPHIPRDLETIVLKAIAKEPAARYQTAEALALDLRRFLNGEPIQARPVGQAERLWRWCRRNPVVAGLTAAVAALLVAAAVSATVAAVQSHLLAQQEERLRKEAEDRADAETTAKEKLEASLYLHRIALAHRELSADNLGRAQELLEECPVGLRQWEWYYLKRLCRVEPTTLRGSEKGVYGVAFSPDGRQLASANGDGTIRLFDVEAGKGPRIIPVDNKCVFGVAFHPDGMRLAFASGDRTVKVCDLTTGDVTPFNAGHADVLRGEHYGVPLAFTPTARFLAASRDDSALQVLGASTVGLLGSPLGQGPFLGALVLWDVAGGRQAITPLSEPSLCSVAFSPDSLLLAAGSVDGVLRIWDARKGELLHRIQGHAIPIAAVAFRPDGRRVATGSFDEFVKVWDVTTGTHLHTLVGHIGPLIGLTFSPDGRSLATISDDKTVKVWNADTGQELLTLRGHTLPCQCVTFSPDGRRLASASLDGTVRIWDATPLDGSEGLEALTLQHDDIVFSVAFSPDGRRIAAADWGRTVRVWDANSGDPIHTLTEDAMHFRVSFSRDGKFLASSAKSVKRGRGTGTVTVWEATTGRPLRSIPDYSHPFCLMFSPDGQYLLKGRDRGDGTASTITIWDWRTGDKVGIVGRHDHEIICLTISPDGHRLASASIDGKVKVWEWDRTRLGQIQEPLLTIEPLVGGCGDRVTFSPDSQHLVTGSEDHTVKVWDVTPGQVFRPLFVCGSSPSVLNALVSTQVALAHSARTFRGHTGDVFCVAASPDGRWIASAGEDTTVRLWDATTGEPVHKLRGHTSVVLSLAFSPDGRRLVSGSRDHTVRVWDLTRLKLRQ